MSSYSKNAAPIAQHFYESKSTLCYHILGYGILIILRLGGQFAILSAFSEFEDKEEKKRKKKGGCRLDGKVRPSSIFHT